MQKKHISSAFDRDLEGIQAKIMKMGGLVEQAILDSAQALETRDLELAERVRSGDAAIDDLQEMLKISHVMAESSHCGLGATAANYIFDTLDKFPYIYEQQLAHVGYEPSFDIDAALTVSRKITERDDKDAHIRSKS